ncbi:hypothetical protein MJM28_27460, partial [Salmonella enterica subsp. enterica serovar Montevideo]|nr:hypothetical protein [Salmonella enterica subsp. enterica serovar Montevideo]
TTQVTALFSGDADTDDATKFANSQGSATGMALEIMTRDHQTENNSSSRRLSGGVMCTTLKISRMSSLSAHI